MIRKFVLLSLALALSLAARTQDPAWEAPLRASLEKMATTLTETLQPWHVPDRIFNISKYGAIGDGATVNTASIQKAIDACTAAGGGVVLVENGDYVTGTIVLKSGVMLEIAKGAKLLGSTNLADYPDHMPRRITAMDTWMKMKQSLIYAEDCDRVGIRGDGVIDGRGTHHNFPGKNTIAETPGRPFMIRILDSHQVVIDGITLRNPACWTQNYLGCDDLIVQNIHVTSQANWNNDGIDIDSCRNVIVRDSEINSEDDGLCFKGAGLRTMENVLVERCKIYSTCNALKFGTDSQAGFRNVLIRHVELGGVPADMEAHSRTRSISGISFGTVDGGTVENILVYDVRIDRANAPFNLRLGDRGRVNPDMAKPAPGGLRRLVFEHVAGANNGSFGSLVSGIPGAKVQDVVFRDIQLSVAGGGTVKDATREVPERVDAYPDAFSFGKTLPSYGFWIRHAERITFDRVTVTAPKPDARPEFVGGVDTADVTVDGQQL